MAFSYRFLQHVALVIFGIFAWSIAFSADPALPPRAQWHASSSSAETPAMASAFAIDGDDHTRWGGSFSTGQWLQVDLGRSASIGGVLIHWDSGFAASYSIQSSEDAQQWHTAYETSDALGGIDYVFFPAVQARYLRLASAPHSVDGDVSIFEFEPLAAQDAPHISGLATGAEAATLWSPGAPRDLALIDSAKGPRELRIDLARALPTAGLEIFWGAARRGAKLEARDPSGKWSTLAEDTDSLGDISYLASREARTVKTLRLTVQPAPDHAPAVQRLRLLSPLHVLTPMKH